MGRTLISEAILLKNSRIGDIHKGVTALTPHRGLLQAIAYGAYKGKSKLGGRTDPFTRSLLYLYHDPVRDSYKITDVEPRSLYEGIRLDLQKYYTASLWAEVILKTFAGGGDSPAMYENLGVALELLSSELPAQSEKISILFLVRVIRELGFFPELDRCGNCQRKVGPGESLSTGIEPFFLCFSCSAETSARLTPGARRYIGYTMDLDFYRALNVSLDTGSLAGLKESI